MPQYIEVFYWFATKTNKIYWLNKERQLLAKTIQTNPIAITVGHKNASAASVKQKLLFCGSEDGKLIAIRQMLQQGIKPPVLIFVQSIERARQLFHELSEF